MIVRLKVFGTITQQEVKSLWSVTDASGFAIVAIATVWLSWSVKYIKKILGNLALKYVLYRANARRNITVEGTATSTTPLLSPAVGITHQAAPPLAKILKETSGIRDLLWEVTGNKSDLSHSEWLQLAGFTLVVAGCGAGMIIGGIRAAGIRSIGPVLMDSKVCGLWLFDGETRSDLAT
ncbi:hypothetical protein BU23DRAFT_263807 [Bimuria novae-zelandiae CBS 107.79]|uniref:Uncharacterized protein n=1 Tax=Bimuria novae-zelandiae CBS 107.79 TaxID=1447943 RepID=A0A6A5UU24_9PLEO|nr:hypothetical protein BU23DRAFT_263807 [Bimuria novae-zelandiae CBS 107.79]